MAKAAMPITAIEHSSQNHHRRQNGARTITLTPAPVAVPDAVAVGGYHAERVVAGRQIGEIGYAARARINPVSIQSFELVLEFGLVSLDVS